MYRLIIGVSTSLLFFSLGIMEPAWGAAPPVSNDTSKNGLIDFYYQRYLKRNASEGEKLYWAQRMGTHEQNDTVRAQIENEGKVASFYRKYLGREAEPQERPGWVRQMGTKEQNEAVEKQIQNSPEAKVVSYYRKYLGRDAKGWERRYWMDRMGTLQKDEGVRQAIETSPEGKVVSYYREYYGRDPKDGEHASSVEELRKNPGREKWVRWHIRNRPEGIVVAAYRNYLGRNPEPEGLEGWMAQMGTPEKDEKARWGIESSPEAKVVSWYRWYLGRPPTSEERARWMGQMTDPGSEETVRQKIAGLPETAKHGAACAADRNIVRFLRDQYRATLVLRKNENAAESYHKAQLGEVSNELQKSTLDAVKALFQSAKALKETGEGIKVLAELIELEKVLEKAETGARKLAILKRLHGFTITAATVTPPSFVAAIIAIDLGVELWEAIERAHHAADFSRARKTLQDSLVDKERQVAGQLAQNLLSLETKCPLSISQINHQQCFGQACAKAVVQDELNADKHNFFYKQLCKTFTDKPTFETQLAEKCEAETDSMIGTLAGNSQSAGTAQLLKARSILITGHCRSEACNLCARQAARRNAESVRNTINIERPKLILNPRAYDDDFLKQYQDYCAQKFPPPPGKWVNNPIREFEAKRNTHQKNLQDIHRWAGIEKREKEATEEKWKAAELAEAEAAKRRALYSPTANTPLPNGVKLSCECFARCPVEGSRLGYLSYRFAREASALRHCKEPSFNFEEETSQKFCGGTAQKPVTCDLRRSDVTMAKDRKCEWYGKPITDASAVYVGDNKGPEPAFRELMKDVFRVMAACALARVKASFCFSLAPPLWEDGPNVRHPVECWNTEGHVEKRTMTWDNGSLGIEFRYLSSVRETKYGAEATNPFARLMPVAARSKEGDH